MAEATERAGAAGDGDGPRSTVAIIGLGLMGGSLARDLWALGHPVLGYDRDAATLEAARASGYIQEAPTSFRGIEDAEVVVLALPVAASLETLTALAPRLRGPLVTDMGSTKRSIVAAAEAAGLADRFVGAHPLAGDHRSGWDVSRAGLFHGAPCFLCPARQARGGPLEHATRFWRSVGADPQPMSAHEHDARLAWVSHLPQATATLLAAALARSSYPVGALGPGGRDTTRLAASSTAMWTDIFLENADQLDPGLDALGDALARLRTALRRGDRRELERLLGVAKAWKDGSPAVRG